MVLLKSLLSFSGSLTSRQAAKWMNRRHFTMTSYILSDASSRAAEDEPVSMPNPFEYEKQMCILCKMNIRPDYKNTKLLSQFVSPYTGRIYGRHITGLCKKRQQQVELEIIKAQQTAIMPYYFKDPVYLKDPKLFNPERPFRSHDY